MISKLILLAIMIIWLFVFGFFTVISPFYQKNNFKYLIYTILFVPTIYFFGAAYIDVHVFKFSKSIYFLLAIFIVNIFMFIPFLFLTDLFKGIHNSVTKSPSIINPEDNFWLVPPAGLDDIPDPGGPKISKEFEGLKIEFYPQLTSLNQNKIMFRGVSRIYVKCGSQLELWGSFPNSFIFELKNNNTEIIYKTHNKVKNRSYAQETLEQFGKMPCDQHLRGYFALNIFENLEDQSIPAGPYEVSVVDGWSRATLLEGINIELNP
ncbi:MAG: hypothetical protein HOO06_12030 [Bdellovibrionaceae bacterium]|jgi:hypothetical protein|nr:hypothetical protein [Pseudobdellovibrionaceae bacterium]